jgi:hypothetical protein
MKTPAIYCRVSTDKQSSGLEAQERALREYLKTQNIQNATFYKDENISGGKSSRPDLDKMMNAAKYGKHDSIVVYSFSRSARSTKHLLEALDEFDRLGVQFISLTEQLDTSSAIGKALFTIISAISQLERELISEKGWGCHAFRHSFAFSYLKSGGNMHELKAILGHKTIAMTVDLYGHIQAHDIAKPSPFDF